MSVRERIGRIFSFIFHDFTVRIIVVVAPTYLVASSWEAVRLLPALLHHG